MSKPEAGEPQVGGRIVRPYTMTGGRAGTNTPLIALEALVAATPEGMRRRQQFKWESAEIIGRSRRETAVIELAALLEVPIGVIRVLADDLRAQGLVTITDPPAELGAEAERQVYTDLLHKVLDGIKSL
jgi:hypothetical protein